MAARTRSSRRGFDGPVGSASATRSATARPDDSAEVGYDTMRLDGRATVTMARGPLCSRASNIAEREEPNKANRDGEHRAADWMNTETVDAPCRDPARSVPREREPQSRSLTPIEGTR